VTRVDGAGGERQREDERAGEHEDEDGDTPIAGGHATPCVRFGPSNVSRHDINPAATVRSSGASPERRSRKSGANSSDNHRAYIAC
jgi:hypothetical protein